ncbi:NEL-type E3 ubiquitin ligase domain-containing protein [Pseudomonas sp. MF7453]|uniref:NEL-type E3 ubiquitin ligase domain-containing protein n=1 Tax=Pseudomonas sp. MF7453 TaxID=2797539 RepID=UPI0018E73A78|nr:NEL-type E3 ubiquitin ligase domain-containing protein [Pseudomonas sp. MF7453]MBJ2216275.1 leucine-rich repeat domain-containing protein [Pseudomonas sp. MF7453]
MPQVNEVVGPRLSAQLPRKLLEMTQDLDIAQTLLDNLPGWLVQTAPETRADIWQAHEISGPLRDTVHTRLQALEPLDEFCIERLEAYLLSKGHTLDVQHDVLEMPHREMTNLNPDLMGPLTVTVTVEKHTLLQAAMQNFSAARAQSSGLATGALIRSKATGQKVDTLSALEFVRCCRELDLGGAYQLHLREVFDLPPPNAPPTTHTHDPVARDIANLKMSDMLLDLHIASGKGHVSKDTAATLLKQLKSNGDTPPSKVLQMDGGPLTWHGLNVDQACAWSVLVFSGGASQSLPSGHCVVYMPNEPERPWFEYDTLAAFNSYLSGQLQVPAYREFFKGYLDESERPDFFQRFDTRNAVESLEAVAVNVSIARFFFDVYVGKAQLDARVLAVPVADVDEEARTALLERYVDLGLTLANVAGFFVPGLGQLMLGVGVGQLLGEVYEGVEDWEHHRKTQALEHLFNVAEGIGSMMVLAAGGKVVGSMFTRTQKEAAAFFDQFDAVRLSGGGARLWRRSLRPYQQTIGDEVLATPSYRGIYQYRGRSYAAMDGALYRVNFDSALGRWRAVHPVRDTAYRPPLEHNGVGGWRHQSEQVDQWHTPAYVLKRLSPDLKSLSQSQLDEIITTTNSQLPWLRQLVERNQALPQRLRDSVVRWRQEQVFHDLIWQLQFQSQTHPSTARLQMFALPLLDGWPQGRFFELLDEHGDLLQRFPDTAPFDYEDLSIHVSEQQINNGQLMQTLLDALDNEEREALLGPNVEPEEAQKALSARLLSVVKEHYGELFEQLYLDSDPLPQGNAALLKNHFPHLPTGMAQELLLQATSQERLYLHNTRRVPLRLAQRARLALHELQEDRAVAGFYLPQLANESTERLAIALLGKLRGWPAQLRVQLHEQTLEGALLGKQENASASVLRKVVKTARGYQAFDERDVALHDPVPGSSGFYQALLNTLSAAQRTRLGIYDTGEPGAMQLQLKLRWQVGDERADVARYLREPSAEPLPAWREACVQAAPPEVPQQPATLLRKVRKLFPLFDEAQASTFVQALGADHLARARAVKALQRNLQTLCAVLTAWRSDKAALAKIPGPLAQARLSRNNIAQRLEACWRRMTGPGEVHRLSLDGMLGGPLPVLPPTVGFEHVRQLSMRNMEVSDELAYFLKHFTGLKSLDVSGNRLTRLPEVVSTMPQLESLYLDNNQLTLTDYTRAKLAGMRSLKSLNLAGNPLIDPPKLHGMIGLRELFLGNCRLKTFPEGLAPLALLEHVDLRDNDITELPNWLFNAGPARTRPINLSRNPLTLPTRMRVLEYRRLRGFGMGVYEDDIPIISEQAARQLWLPEPLAADYQAKLTTWQMLKDARGSDGLFKHLAELGGSADLERVKQDMTRRVWRVLDAVRARADLADEVFEWAGTQLNCDDDAAVSFGDLEILLEVSEMRRQIEGGNLSVGPLLKLGRGLFRLDRLEQIARDYHLKNPATEGLEVSLAFRTGLANRFYLPGQPQHMRFGILAGVTPQALDAAEREVREAEATEAFPTFMHELPYWQKYLKRTHADSFEAIGTPFHTRLQAVLADPDLDEAARTASVDHISRDKAASESAEIQRLTQEAIRAEALNVCAIR